MLLFLTLRTFYSLSMNTMFLERGLFEWLPELLSHHTLTSLALYDDSLLSQSGLILGLNSIITWNLCHTIACIDIHLSELSSHYWM